MEVTLASSILHVATCSWTVCLGSASGRFSRLYPPLYCQLRASLFLAFLYVSGFPLALLGAPRSIRMGNMVVDEQHSPREGVSLFKTKGELDEVRLEAALGHKQELRRNFGLWSLTSLGIVIAK